MNDSFISEIDELLEKKSLLNHPFYKMWSDGKLSMDALRGYAMEYYTLEATFPKLLLEARNHNPGEEDDKVLMDNYNEETSGVRSHADMWLDFAEGVGLDRENVKEYRPLNSTKKAVGDIESLVKKDYLSGIAALLSYEANLQKTSVSKIDGLKAHYGLEDKKSTDFFMIHGVLDIKHSDDWRIVLSNKAKSAGQQSEVKDAIAQSMDALWSFLDGVQERYVGVSAC